MDTLPLLCALSLAASAAAQEERVRLFNGLDLAGWNGDPRFWSVEDGAITGRSTRERPLAQNTVLIWYGTVADFELVLEYRIVGGNSGVHYRSRQLRGFAMAGYEADIDAASTVTGNLHEEPGRGTIARIGQRVRVDARGRTEVVGRIGSAAELRSSIRDAAWNEYRITARGPHLRHELNGEVVAEVEDRDRRRRRAGKLALQLHGGEPMLVQFKNLELTRLPPAPDDDAPLVAGPEPSWIWIGPNGDEEPVALFRREFSLRRDIVSARLEVSCDNEFSCWINGREVARGNDWARPTKVDILPVVFARGDNVLAVEGKNHGGPAALLLRLRIETTGGVRWIVTDGAFRVVAEARGDWRSRRFAAKDWAASHVIGPAKSGPWGNVLDHGSPFRMFEETIEEFEEVVEEVVEAPAPAKRDGEAPLAEWIWSSDKPADHGKAYFRWTVRIDPRVHEVELQATCDNHFVCFLNGQEVLRGDDWTKPFRTKLAGGKLRKGADNVFAFVGRNDGSVAALCARLKVTTVDGKVSWSISGPDVRASDELVDGWRAIDFDDSAWRRSHSFGAPGGWGAVLDK